MLNRNTSQHQIDLTPRQLEILELVSKGCSNADIGRLLDISPNTVKTHLATVLERLHVSNRTEASVWYQKHLAQSSPASHPAAAWPHIEMALLYSDLSRTAEIAENMAHLLRGYEVFQINAASSDHMLSDSKALCQDYLIKIEDLTPVDGDLQISLLSLADDHQHELLYKSEHSLEAFQPGQIIKHAMSIYRQVLAHRQSQTPVDPIFQALLHAESINHQKLQQTLDWCDVLVNQHDGWHLPVAIKSVVLNKLLTNGCIADVQAASHELAVLARKALSHQPQSSWSQLAFAGFCAINADLTLAEQHLQASIQYNPCQLRAWQLLAQIQAFTGQTTASLSTFKKILHDFPYRESDAACYAAMALVQYCAQDFEQTQLLARRALLFADAPVVPMLMTLLSVAEIKQDEAELSAVRSQIVELKIDQQAIESSLAVAAKMVPPALFKDYQHSLHRAGLFELVGEVH